MSSSSVQVFFAADNFPSVTPVSKVFSTEPLPQRVPRNRRVSEKAKSKEPKPSAVNAENKLVVEPDFEVPKDFPYKKVEQSDEIKELDPLTSQVLEDELQNIMIKIWQSLPDDARTEAEQLVAERFRSDAGDDLRNVIGLNVTKRLLNVYNPLMVKVDFNIRPQGDEFRSFLKWLGCVAMQRASANRLEHRYVAQLRRGRDFDRVTNTHTIVFGDLKAKITPCYQFTRCPPNLRTIYQEPEESPEKQETKVKEYTKVKEETKGKQEDSKDKKEEKATTDNKKATEVKGAENKPNTTKNTPAVTKSTEHEFKKPDIPKPKTNQKNVTKSPQANKTTNNQTFIANNKSPTKSEAPKKVEEKPIKKDTPKITPKPKAPVKKPAKTPVKAKASLNKNGKKGKIRKESDFDELDDEDILALMSNAVVLDECSGSDED